MMKYIFLLLGSLLAMRANAKPVTYPASFTVAKDGSGDFTTIQQAINAVRDLSQQRVVIYIKNGVYNEKIVVPSWKNNITLKGESAAGTIISWNDYSGKPAASVGMGLEKINTYTSYTMLVQANDFEAYDLTLQNTAGPVGQAVALHVEGDRAVFINCRLLGHQDTLFAAKHSSRQYYSNCFIEGTTDFIFGSATALFENCTIKSLKNSYITAAATPAGNIGFVFRDCELIADSSVTRVYLGRPWRPNAHTVFIHTNMGNHILPAGWDNWRNPANEQTAYYAEYKSYGPGGITAGRVKWSKQLNRRQANAYTFHKIFSLKERWDFKNSF